MLLPSLDRDVCVAETVRRQIGRPFGRAPTKEEAVIRARFEIYMAMPVPKIETMRAIDATVAEIVAALALENIPLSWQIDVTRGARDRIDAARLPRRKRRRDARHRQEHDRHRRRR